MTAAGDTAGSPVDGAADGSGVVLAVDVGGTKLAAGLVDRSGAVVRSDGVPTPRDADAEALWAALSSLVNCVVAGTPVAGVGIGSAGPMTWPDGEVSPLNIGGWRGFPLRARLAERFRGVPVRIHNDAVCMAVGEHWRGAGRGHADVLGMVVSTGVGGGLVLGGRLVNGGTGNAGHIGHVVVEPDGPPCSCGGRGCLEAVAAGPAVTAWALEHGWQPKLSDTAERLRSGVSQSDPAGRGAEVAQADRVVSARDVAAAAHAGDPVARAAFDHAGRMVGRGVASAAALLDLDVVTIGGGLAKAGPLLFDPLRRAYDEYARVTFARRTQVVPAVLGANAGLVGAAALILDPDSYWSDS